MMILPLHHVAREFLYFIVYVFFTFRWQFSHLHKACMHYWYCTSPHTNMLIHHHYHHHQALRCHQPTTTIPNQCLSGGIYSKLMTSSVAWRAVLKSKYLSVMSDFVSAAPTETLWTSNFTNDLLTFGMVLLSS